jgi:membrane peptidoglycan carboxypeptidase
MQKGFIDYPRAGKEGFWRWVPSWPLVGAIAGGGFALIFFGLLVVYARTPVPQPNPDATYQKTIVYWAADETGHAGELGRFGDVDRHIVAGDKIPVHVKNAVIAAEDRSFRSNRGIDLTGIARATWNNVRGKSLQGGSTITQQYVKNVRLDSQERSLTRKYKEFFISLKINREMDKDDILENYLNTIYFGRGSYGVDAAAHAYFRKDVGSLSVNEAAFLAGIINGPELYDPKDGKQSRKRAKVRWNYVLDGMVEMGTLSAEKRPRKFPEPYAQRSSSSLSGQRGYLLQMVKKELTTKVGLTPQQIDTAGLKVYTTFDKTFVDAAVQAVKDNVLIHSDRSKQLQVALSSVDTQTGAVRSIYGGRDYVKVRQRNAATQDAPMAGSTFKPFTLVAALDKGISLNSYFDGRSGQTFKGYAEGKVVRNYDDEPFGYVDIPTATAKSVNTAYVALNEKTGPRRTRQMAEDMGIPKGTPGLTDGLGNVLGSAAVHPIDMASAYGTIAAQGKRNPWYVVEKVTWPEKDGKKGETYNHPDNSEEVFSQDVAADAAYAMQQVVQRGTGGYAQALGRPVAGKTGTSQENQSAWFVGYTPSVSTSVAMYQLSKGGRGQATITPFGGVGAVTGATYPVRIWTSYMRTALEGTDVETFPNPVMGGRPVIGGFDMNQQQTTSDDLNPGPTPSQMTVPDMQPPTEQPLQPVTPSAPDDPNNGQPTAPSHTIVVPTPERPTMRQFDMRPSKSP